MNTWWEVSGIKHQSRTRSHNLMVHWNSHPFKPLSINPKERKHSRLFKILMLTLIFLIYHFYSAKLHFIKPFQLINECTDPLIIQDAFHKALPTDKLEYWPFNHTNKAFHCSIKRTHCFAFTLPKHFIATLISIYFPGRTNSNAFHKPFHQIRFEYLNINHTQRWKLTYHST